MIENIIAAFREERFADAIDLAIDHLFENGAIDLIHAAGLAKIQMRDIDDGMLMLKTAVSFRPNASHIYSNAGLAAERLGRADDLEFFVTRGLQEFPDDATLRHQQTNVFMLRRDYRGAIQIAQRLTDDRDDPRAYIILGTAYQALGQFKDAERAFDQAALIDPHHPMLRLNRARLYSEQGRIDEAMTLLDGVYDPDARYLSALLALSLGQYEKGWYLHHNRWDAAEFRHASRPQPALRTISQLTGKSVLVLREGGFGDVFMMMRYLPLLAERTATISLHVLRQDVRLLQANLPNIELDLVDNLDEIHQSKRYDYHVAMMDLPYYFNTLIDTIPKQLPYIHVPDSIVDQHRLPTADKPRVGLCWAGGSTQGNLRAYDAQRSLSASAFSKLTDLPADFYSLQMGDQTSEFIKVLQPDFDWLDTAAIIAQMDLIITVDTAIVHLAAAMGKPTWLLSRFNPDWRWLRNRVDSPWYPQAVQVFGQSRYGQWDDVLDAVYDALGDLKWIVRSTT
jgi:tetratricopeptide (TPR) repeat protein